jgi:3-mercaptopyruvate sulfurtransferase SseA
MALMLKRKGIARVRPLTGGIDAWRALDYPLESVVTEEAVVVAAELQTG